MGKIFNRKEFKKAAGFYEGLYESSRKKFLEDSNERIYIPFFNKGILSINREERTLEGIASTPSEDRYGDTIQQDGWQLKNFKANPVLLFGHCHGLPPVGKVISIKVVGDDLWFKAQFAPTELGMEMFELYAGGYMNAFSVGFMPTKWEDRTTDTADGEMWIGMNFLEQELLEISCVPVPANPEALSLAVSKGFGVKATSKAMKVSINTLVKGNDMKELDEDNTEEEVETETGEVEAEEASAEEEVEEKEAELRYITAEEASEAFRSVVGEFTNELSAKMDEILKAINKSEPEEAQEEELEKESDSIEEKDGLVLATAKGDITLSTESLTNMLETALQSKLEILTGKVKN